MEPLPMPKNLAETAAYDGRHEWLETLPATVAQVRDLWSLDLGEPYQPGGMTAWVAPARDATGEPLVLKVGYRHPEADHEAQGLDAWAGQGAVRLRAALELDESNALLIERCTPGTTLAERPEPEQDTVITGLLRRLWITPPEPHPFRPLDEMCAQWADNFEQEISDGRITIDPGLARAGAALFRALPASADRRVLLCTDLHAENVLAAQREPWLVIDPKPYIGDPTYDPLQHMLNCINRLRADPVGLASKLADLLGLERDRLLLWLFARCAIESTEWPGLAEVAAQIPPG